ncbi:MAG: RusA family crossover junction endodeoxyribonuclease [Planctomycetia bacterium]|nr:RusA family crossover junction endodeoxyribonuclease [Planctomycetia bacterium]
MISFIVYTVPVAMPRQRNRIMYIGGKPISQNYTPGKHPVNAFKSAVQLSARVAYDGPPLEGPVYLQATFVLPRPQKYCRKKDDPGRLWCIAKPDMDNLVKALKDALSKLVFKDDSQVCRTMQGKFYAARDEQPCVEVQIGVID